MPRPQEERASLEIGSCTRPLFVRPFATPKQPNSRSYIVPHVTPTPALPRNPSAEKVNTVMMRIAKREREFSESVGQLGSVSAPDPGFGVCTCLPAVAGKP